ncbi:hypothetical protein LCGC14_0175790 [marine sediment metagenome]|uniref:Uncharacterized protein n=1 Tax=marine sediment metagenome TaxID=412755 RepID=A0A0F9URE3_9ZZZZ
MTKEKISERETIAVLLYLIDDLKRKIIEKEKFHPYQLPTLNSIIKCTEESYVLPLKEEEFQKIIIDTKRHILYTQKQLQL